jgi:hypothetical protein
VDELEATLKAIGLMSHPLDPLDPGLLDTLGHQGRQDQLAPIIEPPDPENACAGEGRTLCATLRL